MVVDKKRLDALIEELGENSFFELYNIFLEEVSVIVEGMRNGLMDNNIVAFQGWAHRGKTTAGTFGVTNLSKLLDYYAHCKPEKINFEKAQKLIEECEKEFILAIDEINDYIRTNIQK